MIDDEKLLTDILTFDWLSADNKRIILKPQYHEILATNVRSQKTLRVVYPFSTETELDNNDIDDICYELVDCFEIDKINFTLNTDEYNQIVEIDYFEFKKV